MPNKSTLMLFSLLIVMFSMLACQQSSIQLAWPEITKENKPWSRWWWMGNSVNENDLTTAMEKYQKAGLGGLEITPIYGVKDYEDEFISYLSPQWIDMLQYALQEGKRLDLGIDMATGTGWPFGGPWVSSEDASRYIAYKIYNLKGGHGLDEPLRYFQSPLVRAVGHRVDIKDLREPLADNPDLQLLALDQVRFKKQLPLQNLMAYSDRGETMDLTEFVDQSGRLNWAAPEGNWQLYALFPGWHGKMVERAAPGGEGYVIDHFSGKALENYLNQFDQAFAQNDIGGLRAFFNDSYEVDDASGQADWTPGFFKDFQRLRGYDLRFHVKNLFARGDTEESRRVLSDYKETISDLLLSEFTEKWDNWAVSKKATTRNQAHGSPANILDLYAASGIPETEGNDPLGIKLASSAANVSDKMLTSSETATWLDEHFQASLGDVKKAVDKFFLGGVNHIVYHGTTFSPENEAWPGWMFYASVHFGPTNSFWKDFPVLNNYVARSQSFLQRSQADNDVLLYFPFYDLISQPGREMLPHIGSRISRLPLPHFLSASRTLYDRGFSFDYISDRQIESLQFQNGMLNTGQLNYKTIVIPECNFLTEETFENIIALAVSGANVIVHNKLPADVPGLYELDIRRQALAELKSGLQFKKIENSQIKRAKIGKGSVFIGADLSELLAMARVEREILTDEGLQFIRKKYDDGKIYFINNSSDEIIDGWIPLNTEAASAALFNPMNNVFGRAEWQSSSDGGSEVYLQLQPAASIIVQTFKSELKADFYPYMETIAEKEPLKGSWTIEFTKGGPLLPEKTETENLESWTNFADENIKAFSGTAEYTISLEMTPEKKGDWLLDLGQVHESAIVEFNGQNIASLISYPYQCIIPTELIMEKNELKISVSNLMANRIANLDKKDTSWKKFYNINFPARLTENRGDDGLFTAKHWQPRESGLLGPVTIAPVKNRVFTK